MPTFPSLDCYTATYGTMLVRHGLDPAVLGDEWGYRWRDGRPPAGWPLDGLSIARRPFEEILHFWYGLDVDVRQHPSTEATWQYVCAVIADHRPVIVVVDAYHLPYSPHFQNLHLSHRVILTGSVGSQVEVLDSYRGAPFAGLLPGADVYRAMAAPPAAETAHDCTFEVPFGLTAERGRLPFAAVSEALRESVHRFQQPTQSTGWPVLRQVIDGLRAVGAEGEPPNPTMFRSGITHFAELASQRSLNAMLLGRAADLPDARTGAAALRHAASLAAGISDDWMTVRNVFFLRAKTAPARALERLANRMEIILQREIEMTVSVAEAVDTFGAPADGASR